MCAPHQIDVHHHYLPPDYVRIIGDGPIASLILSNSVPYWTPARSVEVMDKRGIETAVVSMSAPGVCVGDAKATTNLCRHCNEYAERMRPITRAASVSLRACRYRTWARV